MTQPPTGNPQRRRRWIPEREVIGPPECPILHRYTLLDLGKRSCKVMLHRFQPNADDRAEHDHPRGFVTLVLQGNYTDASDDGQVIDHLRPGSVRYRPATHRHVTKVGPKGCTTLVVMGPLRRPWGFWKDGEWWPWRLFEVAFGFGMRCGDDEDDQSGGTT